MVKVAIAQPAGSSDKFKQLLLLEKKLNEQFKSQQTLVRLGDKVGIPIPSISTGLPSIDWEGLQCGGIPRGRIIELFGPESSGKTTACLHIIGCEQKQNPEKFCGFIDAEHALDPTYAKKLGVDVENLVVNQPDCGEQALEVAESMVESGLFSLIVIDSVAALVPKAELEGEMGDAHVGLQARLMAQAMRKLAGVCSRAGVTIIFINQIREKIGVMFGSPETTTGGRALKFYASVRIDVRRRALIKNGEVAIGHKMLWKIVKNKVGSPFREIEIDLIYENGIDTFSDFVNYAVSCGVIEKSGAWYKYNGENIGQGIESTKQTIREDNALKLGIEKKLEEVRKIQKEQ